jgi:hypothetical protein
MIRYTVAAGIIAAAGLAAAAPAMAEPTSTVDCSPCVVDTGNFLEDTVANWNSLPQRTSNGYAALPQTVQQTKTNWENLPGQTASNYSKSLNSFSDAVKNVADRLGSAAGAATGRQ